MIDIVFHILLIAWYPLGVGYLKLREHKQNGPDLSYHSATEWWIPALVLFPMWIGLMIYFWVTAE